MAVTTFLEPGMDATQDGSFFAGLNVSGAGASAGYDSTVSHAGTGSLKCVSGASGNFTSPFTPDGAVSDAGACVSAWCRFSTVSPATITVFFLGLTSSNGSGRLGLGLNTNGTLRLCMVGTTVVSGATVLTANTFYRISISYTNATTSTWAAKVYINGVLEVSATAGVQGTASSNGIVCWSFGMNGTSVDSFGTSANMTMWFDSMYIDNRTDLTDCGAIDVTAKRPFSNGTVNNFTTQIGAGGSGYGSGHAPQVNERPLSQTNGWSMVGAGSAITEEYTIEGSTVGDVSLAGATIVDFGAWLFAKSILAETASIICAGVSSNISLTSTATLFTKFASSSTYPAGGTDIGIVTSTTVTTVSLYECGVIVAYIPGVATTATGATYLIMGV